MLKWLEDFKTQTSILRGQDSLLKVPSSVSRYFFFSHGIPWFSLDILVVVFSFSLSSF